jgi:structural maintenance of chromosome 4
LILPPLSPQRQFDEASKTLSGVEKSLTTTAAETEKFTTTLEAKEAKVVELNAELKQLSVEDAKVSQECASAQAAAEKAKFEINSVKAQSGLMKSLAAAAKRGGPLERAGLLGRLGDLGSIDPKFDVAASSASGMFDSIVVETTEGAQRCVKYLREKNLGRATFIMLDQLGWCEKNLRDGPKRALPNVPGTRNTAQRLIDLITPAEARFLPAFYMAVRDTLVANDLSSGMAMAYHGDRVEWRVVTLGGQLVETSGTMSGGGNRMKKGAMKLSSQGSSSSGGSSFVATMTSEEVKGLEQIAIKLQRTLSDIRNNVQRVTKEIRQTEKDIEKIKTNLQKWAMEQSSLEKRIAPLQKRMDSLQKECSLSGEEETRVRALKKEYVQVEKQYKIAKVAVDKLEREIAQLQEEVQNVGGAETAKQRKIVDKFTKQLDEATNALSKIKVEIKTNERNVAKSKKAADKAAKEIEGLEKSLEKITKEFKKLEDEALKVMESYENAQKAQEPKYEELETMKAEYDELKKMVVQVRTVEVDIQNQLEDYSKILKDNEGKRDHWAAKLREVRKAIAEDEMQQYMAESEGNKTQSDDTAEKDGDENGSIDDNEENDSKDDESKLDILNLPDIDAETLLARFDKKDLKNDMIILEDERDRLKGNVNMGSISEFRRKEQECNTRMEDVQTISDQRNLARETHEGLRRQRLEDFMSGFSVITLKLKEMYQMITLGGDAELELVDSLDPFSEGIVFSVRPSKKSWKNISNLSGGEKTLASLALVFALHHYKPTPLYVMDEIDAALDFKNVSIVANYIKERTRNAQFIIIRFVEWCLCACVHGVFIVHGGAVLQYVLTTNHFFSIFLQS